MVTVKDKSTTVVTHFQFRNETPGALRYFEVDENGKERKGDSDGAVIATLYLRKLAMEGKVMKRFKMEITELPE